MRWGNEAIHTSELARVLLLDRAVVEETHGDSWVYGEAIKRISWASPLLGQTLHQDTDDDLRECHHPGLICKDDVLELLTREVRPQVRAGQEAACLRIICRNLTAHDKCLNAHRICQNSNISQL